MPARWNFMVYLAGNNSLSTAADDDLEEMRKVGSTSEVRVLAFVKQASGAPRYLVVGQREDETENLPANTDSGDPQTVVDFIRWAVKKAPAEHHALVMWNHGGGWAPDDFDQLYSQTRGAAAPRDVNRLRSKAVSRVLFRPTMKAIFTEANAKDRAILSDDVTGHSLDTIEMQRVLARAAEATQRPLDLFGMDACLMSTLEVAHQIREQARVVVGSEELEPGAGWAYDAILGALNERPTMTGAELGKAITGSYADFYKSRRSEWPITQAAVDISQLDGVASAVDKLAKALAARVRTRWDEVVKAQAVATKFDFEMVDLQSFCNALLKTSKDASVKSAAKALVDTLRPGGYVISEEHLGQEVEGCGGVSVYLPNPASSRLSKYYADLSFSQQHGWAGFLHDYFRSVHS